MSSTSSSPPQSQTLIPPPPKIGPLVDQSEGNLFSKEACYSRSRMVYQSQLVQSEGNECPLCLFANQPKLTDDELKNHLRKKHPESMFVCSLCDDQKFISHSDLFQHLSKIHDVEETVLPQLMRIPSFEYLKIYRCGLCKVSKTRDYIGFQDSKLFEYHFRTVHKLANNVEKLCNMFIKRVCRVCLGDKFASDNELTTHIYTEHPPSKLFVNAEAPIRVKLESVDPEDALDPDGQSEEAEPETNASTETQKVDNQVSKQSLSENNLSPQAPANNCSFASLSPSWSSGSDSREPRKSRSRSRKLSRSRGKSSYRFRYGSRSPEDSNSSGRSSQSSRSRSRSRQRSRSRWKSSNFNRSRSKSGLKMSRSRSRTRKRSRSHRSHSRDSSRSCSQSSKSSRSQSRSREFSRSRSRSRKRFRSYSQSYKRRRRGSRGSRSRSSSHSSNKSRSLSCYKKARLSKNGFLRRHEKRTIKQISSSTEGTDLTSSELEDKGEIHEWNPRIEMFDKRIEPPGGFCRLCSVTYTSKGARNHFKGDRHLSMRKYRPTCLFCNHPFDDIRMHLKNQHENDGFKCTKCSFIKTTLEDIIRHFNGYHTETWKENLAKLRPLDYLIKGYIKAPKSLIRLGCNLCNQNFLGQSVSSVILHQLLMDDVKIPRRNKITFGCRVCPKSRFENKMEQENHVEDHWKQIKYGGSRPMTILVKEPILACPICNDSFDSEDAKLKHLDKVHEKEMFCCKFCQFTNVDFGVMMKHLEKKHSIKEDFNSSCSLPADFRSVECSSCNKKWLSQDMSSRVMLSHCKDVHNHSKIGLQFLLKCRLCPFTSNLDYHYRWEDHCKNHHETTSSTRLSDTELQRTCIYCEALFSTPKDLQEHATSHNSSKFACKICSDARSSFRVDTIESLGNHFNDKHGFQEDIKVNSMLNNTILPDCLHRFYCHPCGLHIYSESYEGHLKSKHSKDKRVEIDIKCRICSDLKFSALNVLQSHAMCHILEQSAMEIKQEPKDDEPDPRSKV